MSCLGIHGRSYSGGVLVNTNTVSTNEPGNVPSVDVSQTALFHHGNSCSSVRTPGFHSLRKGQLPVNNFSSSYDTITKTTGISHGVVPGWWVTTYHYSGDMSVNGRYPYLVEIFSEADMSTTVAAQAREQLLKNIGNLKFNVAVALAEQRQTAKLLSTQVNRLANFFVALRRGNLAAAERVLNARSRLLNKTISGSKRKTVSEFDGRVLQNARRELFGEGYGNRKLGSFAGPLDYNTFPRLLLEYSYGWKPLVNDIYGAAELLAQQMSGGRPMIATGTAQESRQFQIVRDSSYAPVTRTFNLTGSANFRSKAVAHFTMSDPCLDAAKRTGLSNPALVAWELMPYSFVVDWLWPVGSYLENLAASQGLIFAGGFQTTVSSYELQSSMQRSGGYFSEYGGVSKKGASISRVRLDSFPTPNFPSVKNPLDLNLKQVSISLALISQAFNR